MQEKMQSMLHLLNILKGVGHVTIPGSEEDKRITRMFERQIELIFMAYDSKQEKYNTQELQQHDIARAHASEVLMTRFQVLLISFNFMAQKAGEYHPEFGLACQTLALQLQEIVASFYELGTTFPVSQAPIKVFNQPEDDIKVKEV